MNEIKVWSRSRSEPEASSGTETGAEARGKQNLLGARAESGSELNGLWSRDLNLKTELAVWNRI